MQRDGPGALPRPRDSWAAWSILALLLAALVVGALTYDRSEWPSLVGDEATYLMMAESLAWDLDLRYERGDFDRFTGHWTTSPEGLILNGGTNAGLYYGKPLFYSLAIAPLTRISPQRGPFLTNALLLTLAALLVARSLKRRLGNAAPIWVGIWIFASVGFAYTFWAHADLFLLVAVAIALTLTLGAAAPSEDDEPERRSRRHRRLLVLRWSVAGVLLAAVCFSRPLYLPLLLPPLVAASGRDRHLARASLIAGAVMLTCGAAWVHQMTAGSWSAYTGERRAFYSYTGFPAVDFDIEAWSEKLEESGSAAWVGNREKAFQTMAHPALVGWNVVYFLIGRHVGVLPYFLPLLLGCLALPRGRTHWALLLAVAASIGLFFLLRPFNFFGGGASIANRYFLPLYPALWFLVHRPIRLAWAAVTVLGAALFLLPLWTQPRTYPLREDSTYRHVSSAARRVLPHETTQSHLKPAGQEDVMHHGLWVKLLDPGLRSRGHDRPLQLRPGASGSVLVGSRHRLDELVVEVARGAEDVFSVVGEIPETDAQGRPDANRRRIRLGRPRARHPMWWSWDPYFLYRIDVRSEAADLDWIGFALHSPEPGPAEHREGG